MPRHFLANKDEFPKDASRSFIVDGRHVLVVNDGGTLLAYRNFCPHMGAPLRYVGCQLKCDWHGSLFDAATGEPKTGPAVQSGSLERIELHYDGDAVHCEIEEMKASPWADDF